MPAWAKSSRKFSNVSLPGSSGGGNVLASPGDINDTDTIHTSGNSVTVAIPSKSPLTSSAGSEGVTRRIAIARAGAARP